MSQVATYNSEICLGQPEPGQSIEQLPGWEILRQAVEAVAEEKGGRVTRQITDYFGRHYDVDFAVITPEFPRGLGIKVSRATGEVRFMYDAYGGYEPVVRGLTESIQQNHSALAVARALEEMNYQVELEEVPDQGPGRKVVLVRGTL
ncbi:MAG: hypothetical protein AB1503_06970 [Bacillota bacterium]|jgi:hypothetical protein|nr:hypothetical protein [Bacillota bacterium]